MATASISSIGRAVGDRLQDGMTWKKITRPAGENEPLIIKLDTLIECKDLLDWSNVGLSFNIKIFLTYVILKCKHQMYLFLQHCIVLN